MYIRIFDLNFDANYISFDIVKVNKLLINEHFTTNESTINFAIKSTTTIFFSKTHQFMTNDTIMSFMTTNFSKATIIIFFSKVYRFFTTNNATKNFMITNSSKAIATTFFFTTIVQFTTSDAINNFTTMNFSKAIEITFSFSTFVRFITNNTITIQKKTMKLFKTIKKTIKAFDIIQTFTTFDII